MNVNIATLRFRPDGQAEGLYTEAIDLMSLGALKVDRLTKIEFDNANQSWRVCDLRGRLMYSSPSRIDCLQWEWKHLNARDEYR